MLERRELSASVTGGAAQVETVLGEVDRQRQRCRGVGLLFGFLNFLPYSKHFHVLTSLFNVYFLVVGLWLLALGSQAHAVVPVIVGPLQALLALELAGEEFDALAHLGVRDIVGYYRRPRIVVESDGRKALYATGSVSRPVIASMLRLWRWPRAR